MPATKIIKVFLFIAPNCPHCPNVLQALAEMIKTGEIAELEVTNISMAPAKAQQMGVRSVPWIKMGPFEFTGAHSKKELRHWLNKLHTPEGMVDYFNQLYTTGQLNKAIELVKKDPSLMKILTIMLGEDGTPLGSLIGISATLEEFTGSDYLNLIIPELIKLTTSAKANTRNDACYYLGLSRNPQVLDTVRTLLDDEHHEVVETAREAIESIIDK